MLYIVFVDNLVIYTGPSYTGAVAAADAGATSGHPATVYMVNCGPVYVKTV